ncbi:metallophosphoesterase [Marinagarivorans cellulosilyticus]|uniref:Calcineurin-like phosphoesterase domain-containing protein n=1 Tax=Marinagarivorans cellulosilyticus TaxID=2721545 RepID=A0AAN1WEX7_9GAMM|nr:metallophosphoesterase [Marinagarivorans cellulosilyticus]BCD96340.1 hypothetical protein MARGE09_P0540 [Marinagarivorans cellulosilyticus]
MKIQLLSDLHIEFERYDYKSTDCDVVVLAGDIHTKYHGINWALDSIPDKPVLYVLGNHEYYKKAYPKLIDSIRELCKGTNVRLLENDHVNIEGVNFLGCTLWTDFELYGDAKSSGIKCQEIMNDFKKIRVVPGYRKLRSLDVATIHHQSRKWLSDKLEALRGQRNVVITHHSPSARSIPADFLGDDATPAYASNLESLIRECKPELWLHGHLHRSLNYEIDKCRVICNPKGYAGYTNLDFNEKLIVYI